MPWVRLFIINRCGREIFAGKAPAEIARSARGRTYAVGRRSQQSRMRQDLGIDRVPASAGPWLSSPSIPPGVPTRRDGTREPSSRMWSRIQAMATQPAGEDLKMDPTDLYREDVVTDRRVGTIRVLVPVKIDGSTDPARTTLYLGEAQMLTPAGVLPLTFPIEARTLAEAVEKFGDEAKVAVERAVEELQQLRREAASSIIVPDRMPPGALGGPGLGGPGPPPGGGRIKLR